MTAFLLKTSNFYIYYIFGFQVTRLEGQVTRYKSAAENAEKVEDEMKAEKRKLQREVRVVFLRCKKKKKRRRHASSFNRLCFNRSMFSLHFLVVAFSAGQG